MTTPPQYPLNPRDFVELLEKMMFHKIVVSTGEDDFGKHEDRLNEIKRQLTDYLLDIDKRPGVYVKGENE